MRGTPSPALMATGRRIIMVNPGRSATAAPSRRQVACVGVWARWRARLAHAFAVCPSSEAFAEEELALLDRLADLLARRGLAAPALFIAESLAPLGFLGSQLLHALTPVLEAVASPGDLERLARLLERRETPGLLIERLRRREERTP